MGATDNPAKSKKEFLDCIAASPITGIRAGTGREKFTGIWMVVVDGRVFGRSYYGAARSWYTKLVETGTGDLRCGIMIVPVRAARPKDLKKLATAINQAYENKYLVKSFNKKWVDGLKEPERAERTMEFILP